VGKRSDDRVTISLPPGEAAALLSALACAIDRRRAEAREAAGGVQLPSEVAAELTGWVTAERLVRRDVGVAKGR
jgi:hypothetical protein